MARRAVRGKKILPTSALGKTNAMAYSRQSFEVRGWIEMANPRLASSWKTLPISAVGLPRSISPMSRGPTPARAERSSWVTSCPLAHLADQGAELRRIGNLTVREIAFVHGGSRSEIFLFGKKRQA
jgi:hypothetical protein